MQACNWAFRRQREEDHSSRSNCLPKKFWACLGYLRSDTVSNPKGKVKEKKKKPPKEVSTWGFLTPMGLYFFWPYLVCVCMAGVILIRVHVWMCSQTWVSFLDLSLPLCFETGSSHWTRSWLIQPGFRDLPVSTFSLLYATSKVLQENSIVPGPSCGIWGSGLRYLCDRHFTD